MNALEKMRCFLNLSKKLFTDKKVFPLSESNVMDVYKHLTNNKNVPEEELKEVQKRFYELVNYESKLL